jgi:hypothetical protein
MRIARKVVLLCAAALVATALGASAASAQEEPVEFWKESGTHCEPCYIHIIGESEFHSIIGAISECQDEFEVEVWEDPDEETGQQGHVYNYTNSDESPVQPCTRQMCNGVGEPATETEWPFGDVVELGPNEGHLFIEVCLDTKANPNAMGAHCLFEIDFEEHFGHHTEFSTNSSCIGGAIQFIGEWESELVPSEHDAFEIVHL